MKIILFDFQKSLWEQLQEDSLSMEATKCISKVAWKSSFISVKSCDALIKQTYTKAIFIDNHWAAECSDSKQRLKVLVMF